jgi:hypothetical protein
MADHGEMQYATAEGNDYPAHEDTYRTFVHIAFVGTLYVINILLGLAIGGVLDRWLIAAAIIVIATLAAIYGLAAGTRASTVGAFIISFLAFALSAAG